MSTIRPEKDTPVSPLEVKPNVDNGKSTANDAPFFTTSLATPGYELESYELQTCVNARIVTASAEIAPVTSRPSSSLGAKAARRAEYLGYGTLLWTMFLQGWNDGTSGPMLPVIQRYYDIGFAVVSLVFVLNCVGFVTGGITSVFFSVKYGFGKTLIIGAISQTIAYILQAPAPPFPVFAIAYIFSGFGIALQNSQSTVFTVSLRNSATKMGILHSFYGLGALTAPLVATQFAQLPHWSFHYLVSLGGAILNVIFLTLAFRFQRLDVILVKAGQTVREQGGASENLYAQIMKLKVVHLLAFFALAYIGVEVTLGGWIVTFIIDTRGGGSSSGYIASGFFAGMTLGRVGLLWFSKLVGERRVVWLYIAICVGLEITIWVVPSLIGNAVAVSFIGLFIGPVYPIVMNRTARLVPHWLIPGAVGWISGLGMTGSAALPFITGVMSSKLGITSLQPLVVSVMCLMSGLWVIIPADVRHSD